jgi:hypothetical protein
MDLISWLVFLTRDLEAPAKLTGQSTLRTTLRSVRICMVAAGASNRTFMVILNCQERA